MPIFTVFPNWKQSKCPSKKKQIINCVASIKWNTAQQFNRNNAIDIFKYMDESQISCAHGKKANSKGDRQCDSTDITFWKMQSSKNGEHICGCQIDYIVV